jgi:hypothetical protein
MIYFYRWNTAVRLSRNRTGPSTDTTHLTATEREGDGGA